MPALPNRQTLETMKRADLQKLCKDHGIKANLKSEALVDLLLDTVQPSKTRAASADLKRSTSIRIVSQSSAGIRPRGRSGGSVVIHDTDDEDDTKPPPDDKLPAEPMPEPEAPLLPRARKAKATQLRLGMGRPVAVGGSGARAVTKSLSGSKLPRVVKNRNIPSIKPSEAAIQEEEEEEESLESTNQLLAGPSRTPHDIPVLQTPDQTESSHNSSTPPSINLQQIRNYVTETMQPMRDQIVTLQSEIHRLTGQLSDVNALEAQVRELVAEVDSLHMQSATIVRLENEVSILKEHIAVLRTAGTVTPDSRSFGKSRAIDADSHSVRPVANKEVSSAAATTSRMKKSYAQSLLGKRHRDAEDSNNTDILESGKVEKHTDDQLANNVLRPSKKRAKLEQDLIEVADSSMAHEEEVRVTESNYAPRGPSFTVFSGPEEPPETYIDPPPPTTHISDFFGLPPSRHSSNAPITRTATANAPENQPLHAFNFSFTNPSTPHLATSTPAAPFGMAQPAFPYPESSVSPTPDGGAGPSGGYIERAGGRLERNDLFHPFGAPPRPRSSSGSRPHSRASKTEDLVNPSALIRSPVLSGVMEVDGEAEAESMSSSQVGYEMGASSGFTLPPDTPAAPMKRTMYGTELEGDTRFGDFGLEGVATGFWKGSMPKF